MKVEIEEITITIKRSEAHDIINALTKSLDPIKGSDDHYYAYELKTRLQSIFMNSVKGIHF